MNRYISNKAWLRGSLVFAGLACGLGLGMPAIAAGNASYAQVQSSGSSTIPDDRIAADVREVLDQSVPKPYTVTARTDHGVVFLSGELMSQDAIVSLSTSIANVEGVKAVNVRGLDAPFITITY